MIFRSSLFSLLLFLGLLPCNIHALETPGFRKGPYLIYPGQPDQMTVLWQLNTTETCTLEWGTDSNYSDGNVETEQYGDDFQHKFKIFDLNPSQLYEYRVTAGATSKAFTFRAAPTTDTEKIKMFCYGDTRTFPQDHNKVAEVMLQRMAADRDFQTVILNTGDFVNIGNSELSWDLEFFNPVYPAIQFMLGSVPTQGTMGNHEVPGDIYKKYWPYPYVDQRYWSFDYGPAHITVVDQYAELDPFPYFSEEQMAWIENDLATTTKRWKFIVLHWPGWSAGNPTIPPFNGHLNFIEVQKKLQPLCLKYDVPLVLGGHNHFYARCTIDGVHHITSGGGGAPRYNPDFEADFLTTATMTLEYTTIEIDGDDLAFRAWDLEGKMIDELLLKNYPVSQRQLRDFLLGQTVLTTEQVALADYNEDGELSFNDLVRLVVLESE